MKKIRFLQNYFPINLIKKDGTIISTFRYKEGDEMVATEENAKFLTKKRIRILKNNTLEEFQIAEVIQEFGLHFGRSKHIYIKNGESEINS